jgi:hypothetical protein
MKLFNAVALSLLSSFFMTKTMDECNIENTVGACVGLYIGARFALMARNVYRTEQKHIKEQEEAFNYVKARYCREDSAEELINEPQTNGHRIDMIELLYRDLSEADIEAQRKTEINQISRFQRPLIGVLLAGAFTFSALSIHYLYACYVSQSQ